MTDIFISYARENRQQVELIAQALEGAGHRVWWDPHIKTGSGFRQEIQAALDASTAVIVLWSEHSVTSRFVCDEADEGASRDVLFPALIDLVDIPLGFRQIQTADLTGWRGRGNHPKFREYIRVVSDFVDGHRGRTGSSGGGELAAGPVSAVPAERPMLAPKSPPAPAGGGKPRRDKTFVTGRGLRLALLWRSIALTVLIASAFAALAYYSDFLYEPFRPAFVAIMAVLVFVSRFGTFQSDRTRGAASLHLMSRSYLALLLFSLIAISPLLFEGRLYTETLRAVQMKGIEGADINGVEFSADGKRLVTASDDGTARVWDTDTGVQRLVLRGHTDWVWHASFSPDGTAVVTASRDLTARIWDARTGAQVRTLKGHLATVQDARYLRSGKEIATASADKTVRIWNAETGEVVRTLEGHQARVRALAISPDGRLIASVDGGGGVRVWGAAGGELRASFEVPGVDWQDVTFDTSSDRIAAAGEDGQAFIWRISSRQWLATVNHTSKLFAVAFVGADELATGGLDSAVRIWKISSGDMVREILGHRDATRNLSLSDKDIATGVRALSLSPDGKLLATGSRDNTARIWDLASGAEMQIVGHNTPAIKSPVVLDIPPWLYASHAPTSANLLAKPSHAAELLTKGSVLALAVLVLGFLVKGVLAVARAGRWARWALSGTLALGALYVLAMALTDLPMEASLLWLIFGFVPAALISVGLWLALSMLTRQGAPVRRTRARRT